VFGLGPTELLLILVVVVLLFGSRKLPELGTGMGEAIKNFKKGYRDSKAIDVNPTSSNSSESANSIERERQPKS
jgi:sec-independent protein translocase protein TatA